MEINFDSTLPSIRDWKTCAIELAVARNRRYDLCLLKCAKRDLFARACKNARARNNRQTGRINKHEGENMGTRRRPDVDVEETYALVQCTWTNITGMCMCVCMCIKIRVAF